MQRFELERGAWVVLDTEFVPANEARLLREELATRLDWKQRHIVLFGRRVLQPRLIAWMGALPYRYSGQTLEPRPWPEATARLLEPLTRAVCAASSGRFNHVLVNRYRDGRDSMGYHADDEPELGPDPVIACVSLGRTRRFALRDRARRGREGRALELALGNGSLIVMGGSCQRHYRHAILREHDGASKTTERERISLTFRRLLRSPGASGSPAT